MTKIRLLDTGYVSASGTSGQTQIAAANRAGYNGSSSVTYIELDVTNLKYVQGANLEDKKAVNSTSTNEVSLATVKNERITVSFRLKKEEVTSGFQVNELFQMRKMEQTFGVKLLYVDAKESIDGYLSILEQLGRANESDSTSYTGSAQTDFASATPNPTAGTIPEEIPFMIGRISNLQLTDSSDSIYYTGSFEFHITT